MIEIDGNGLFVTAALCCRAIDEAVAAGHDKSLLRWSISPSQRRAIMHFVIASCSPVIVDEIVNHGAPGCGMWCGIPFVVDPGISKTAIVLEVVTKTEPVAIMRNMGETR